MKTESAKWPLLAPLCLLIILLSVLRVAGSAANWDSTYDEYWHLLWSERALLDNNFEREYSNFVSTTPVSMLNAGARHMAQRLGVVDADTLTAVARIPTVVAFLVLLATVYVLGKTIAGPRAGLLAASLTALDANVLTHSALSTVDIYFAVITLGFVFQCARYVRHPVLSEGLLLAVVTGLAFAIKLSSVLFLPLLLVVLLLGHFQQRQPGNWNLPIQVILGMAVVFLVINGSYKFHAVGFQLGELAFVSPLMQNLSSALPWLYLPLPQDFILSFDGTLNFERNMEWNTVIFNQYFTDGVWYYFPVTWLFKTPLALIFLLACAVVAGISRGMQARSEDKLSQEGHSLKQQGKALLGQITGTSGRAEVMLLASLWAVFFFYFNFVFRTHVGLRYIVMSFPMLYLLAAALLSRHIELRRYRLGVGLVLVVALMEHQPYWGNSLSYSNALIHDKKNAWRVLTDSNIDWGQNYSEVFAHIGAEFPEAALNPIHIMPGQNIIRLNFLAGVFRNFEQHRWVRENLMPAAHVMHTHLRYTVSGEEFAAFLSDENTLPTIAGVENCNGTEVSQLPYTTQATDSGYQLLCVNVSTATLQMRVIQGSGVTGGAVDSSSRRCEGYTVNAEQRVVFRQASSPGKLCFYNLDSNTRWELSEFEY